MNPLPFPPADLPATAASLVGVGLKVQHLPQVLGSGAHAGAEPSGGVDFVEVHAENYMVQGGPFLRHLERVRERMPLSIHGVGLSIGGTGPLDGAHLTRLRELLRRFEPQWFSEHLAWSSHGGQWFNDLLPVPYHADTLVRVCSHIDQVQDTLGRRMLLENPSTYVAFEASSMDEAAFLCEVVRRTGCGLLLDVTNAHVSAVNHHRDPWQLISALPSDAIGECHLAGFEADPSEPQDTLLIDTHGQPVDPQVWALYERTVRWHGPRPTLIERDQNIPPWGELMREADRVRALTGGHRATPSLAQAWA